VRRQSVGTDVKKIAERIPYSNHKIKLSQVRTFELCEKTNVQSTIQTI
jgi:hypothetical protein